MHPTPIDYLYPLCFANIITRVLKLALPRTRLHPPHDQLYVLFTLSLFYKGGKEEHRFCLMHDNNPPGHMLLHADQIDFNIIIKSNILGVRKMCLILLVVYLL
jgi:hypothetical protein